MVAEDPECYVVETAVAGFFGAGVGFKDFITIRLG